MALLKINRGLEANLPEQIVDGNIYFCTDTGNFYIDYETSRVHINANKAQALTYYDKELGQYIDIDADYLMELLQSKATSIYIQPEEPVDAPEGSLWIKVEENDSEDDEEKEFYITVNGIAPDINGNIELEIPEGFSGSWNDLSDKPFEETDSGIKYLDEKFIPDTIARAADIPEVNYPVTSVNGQTGDVRIELPNNFVTSVNGQTGDVLLELPKGFSGSWNDLTDKPFEKNAGNTVEMLFDGNLDGRTTIYMGLSSTSPAYESTYVKMSDLIPEKEWFLGHNIVITDAQKGGTYNFTITEETLNEIIDSEEANLPSEYLPEGSFWLMSELIIVFREKTVMLAPSGDSYLTFEPGVWFSYMVFEESANAVQPMYCTELSFSSPAFIKYIDEDVIPNTIARKNNISWDDLKYKPFDYIKKDTQFHYEWNGIWDEVTNKDARAYKIDSIVPQPYDLFGSTITRWSYGKIQEYTVEASNVYDIGDNNFSVVLNSSDALLCLNNPLGSIAPGLYLMVNRADTDEGVIYDYFKSLSYTCSQSYAQMLSDMYIPSSVPVITRWAEVGQTVIVTEVDQQGRPLAWDVVDFPTIDASEYYTKAEIDALLNDYITTIDTLVGEEE